MVSIIESQSPHDVTFRSFKVGILRPSYGSCTHRILLTINLGNVIILRLYFRSLCLEVISHMTTVHIFHITSPAVASSTNQHSQLDPAQLLRVHKRIVIYVQLHNNLLTTWPLKLCTHAHVRFKRRPLNDGAARGDHAKMYLLSTTIWHTSHSSMLREDQSSAEFMVIFQYWSYCSNGLIRQYELVNVAYLVGNERT